MFKIDYLDIRPGYVITKNGDILNEYGKSIEYYISSNGYKYGWFYNKKSEYRLYPIDDIICFIINGISDTLLNIPVKCIHINGDLLDNDPSNLKWVEDFEEWRVIVSDGVKDDTYMISNFGNVINMKYGNYIKHTLSKKGYPCVSLSGTRHREAKRQVHRLIAEAFINNPEPIVFNQVNHIDCNKLNYNIKNLEWVDNRANQYHAKLSNLVKPRPSKITTDETDYIRDLLLKYDGRVSEVYGKIDHDKFPNITVDIVRDVKRNKKTYFRSNRYDLSSINFPEYSSPPPLKLKIDEIDYIRDLLLANDGDEIIVFNILNSDKQFNEKHVSLKTVENIKNGSKYNNSLKYNLEEYPRFPWCFSESEENYE